ncbi:MAG TPA: UDP-N-acetylmuramoyl-tripeptide--D-alanyl-D-alanine ligase, partial [Acidimicrobiales bacterium]|nr:UDP-N-acetylmuramoyl-tripeptide--D-alanyl-D-alanine ligase [Acidimicrobiales bacterium]
MRLRASWMAEAAGGALVGEDTEVEGAVNHSQVVVGGELFVAVVSDRDGHDFIADALERGAAAYLTSRPPVGGTAVVVADTQAALLDLGRAARRRLPDRVVGVTGSVGKTSVKDLLAAALAPRFRVAASAGSFNNELGVPLTLLNAPDDAEALVVEMGARGPGHVALLCEVAAPTVAVVTRVAAAHTAVMGDLERIARSKGELVEALPASGTAVLNAADPRVAAMASRTAATVVRFGAGGDVVAEEVRLDDELRPSFRLRSPEGDADVRLGVAGHHQVDNALAAAAAAVAVGASLDDVVTGLASARLSPMRMALGRAPSGAVVLNDAYNANPASMAAGLRALAALPARRRLAFLGTMAELGERAVSDHRDVAALAAELGVQVVAVGEPAYGVEVVPDVAAAASRAAVLGLGEGDAVLV